VTRVKEMTARLVSFLIVSKCPCVFIAQERMFGSPRSGGQYRDRGFSGNPIQYSPGKLIASAPLI